MTEPGDGAPSAPLAGVRIIELAGLGALPYASLRLADMGADVVRIDRMSDSTVPDDGFSPWNRGRRSIAVDLKRPGGVETVLRLVDRADAFCEAFRPGVAERLGLGPDVVRARNSRIVYGRLTGWGQTGPLAAAAGHSLNYEALTGVIDAVGAEGGPPVPVLMLLGDFAGGGLTLAYGRVCALFAARRTGRGRVVDAAMVDGVAALATTFYGMQQAGLHAPARGTNLFDGGAPFYAVYETADGRHVSVASIEPQFWALLLDLIGLDAETMPDQWDRAAWPETRRRLAEVFRTRTREQWCAVLEGTDACFAPVLTFDEAREHPHLTARRLFGGPSGTAVEPTPQLSDHPGAPSTSPAFVGADADTVLADSGLSSDEIADLRADGVIT